MINICADSLAYQTAGSQQRRRVTPEEADANLAAYFEGQLAGNHIGAVALNVLYHRSSIPCETMDTVWRTKSGVCTPVEKVPERGGLVGHYTLFHEYGVEPYAIAMKHIRSHGAQTECLGRMEPPEGISYQGLKGSVAAHLCELAPCIYRYRAPLEAVRAGRNELTFAAKGRQRIVWVEGQWR